jgi:hypothetical protein
MLADIINKYPAMQNVYDLNKTKVMYGTPERIIASKIHGGGGYLEYWPQEEEGLPQFPHPSPGNTVLEIYNQEMMNNPIMMRSMIYGDLLHGMPKDKNWADMRERFIQNYRPETLQFEESQGRPGGWGKDDENRYSRHDAYIRAKMVPPGTQGYTGWNDDLYSPEQMNILKQMQNYLQTGVINNGMQGQR